MSSHSLRSPVCLCLAALGCTEAADIPDVPDLEALARQYEDPSAALDATEVSQALAMFPELERFASALRSSAPLLDHVEDGREAAGQRSGSGIDLRGALTITANCPGPDAEPRFDDASTGTVALDLAVQDGVIKQAFWAQADHCLLRGVLGSLEFPVELDGRIAFDIGAPIGLGRAWQRDRALVSLLGSLSLGDTLTLRGLSARVGAADVEYLQQLPGGNVVLFANDKGVGVRDRDATWFCERGGNACGVR